jgi:hypothetical protein
MGCYVTCVVAVPPALPPVVVAPPGRRRRRRRLRRVRRADARQCHQVLRRYAVRGSML